MMVGCGSSALGGGCDGCGASTGTSGLVIAMMEGLDKLLFPHH